MFTTGRIIFIAVFVTAFVAYLFWSYSKDRKVHRVHFRKAYLVLIAIILFLLLQFLIVKVGGFI